MSLLITFHMIIFNSLDIHLFAYRGFGVLGFWGFGAVLALLPAAQHLQWRWTDLLSRAVSNFA